MTHRLRFVVFLGAAVVFTSAVAAPSALAAPYGVETSTLTPIYKYAYTIPQNTTTTFKTFSLSSGGDTVLHVQISDTWSPAGDYVAGNDDCSGSPEPLSSCVTIPAVSYGRPVVVLVRSYGDNVTGTARLERNNSQDGVYQSSTFTFGGHKILLNATAPTNSVVATTRILQSATDTILMALSSTAIAVDFSDDGGPGYMSSFAANAPFNMIVVGTYNSSPTGVAKTIWDDRVSDGDFDGLGAGLESVLGTSTTPADGDGDGQLDGYDTDNDGLSDSMEVFGVDATPPAAYVELPTLGADPLMRDVFVEADWDECDIAMNPACNNNIDFNKRDAAWAAAFQALYAWPNPDPQLQQVKIHFDIGVDNTAPFGDPSLTQWGNWGGANRRPLVGGQPSRACDSMLNGRKFLFHLGLMSDWGNAGTGDCFITVAVKPRVGAHELGHNFSLDHGGNKASGGANYKAIYESPMNYAYQDNVSVPFFARNKYGGVSFNPRAVDETTWSNGGGQDLSLLTAPPFGYLVQGASVDWNQDGQILSGATLGRANWPAENGAFRSVLFGADRCTWTKKVDPNLVSAVTPSGRRVYVFARETTAGADFNKTLYRYSTDMESGCSAFTTDPWSACATFSSWTAVPNTEATTRTAAAVEYVDGTRKIMLLYVNSSNQLRFQILDLTSGTWTAPATAGGSVSGSLAAAYDATAGRVDVYAGISGLLRRWSYRLSTHTWDITGTLQTWSTGGNVTVDPVPGVAWGYLQGTSTPYLFALIPHGTSANADFARRNGNQWIKISTPIVKMTTRPGFVYRPFSNSAVTVGRFLALFRDVTYGSVYPAMITTQGNDSACGGSRSLCSWIWNVHKTKIDQAGVYGASMMYDPAYDTNVRAAYTDVSEIVDVNPIADSGVNAIFKDQNDYSVIKKNLKCSLSGAPCWDCTQMYLDGTCSTWVPIPPPPAPCP